MESPPPPDPAKKTRLDVLLAVRGFARSRAQAQEMIRNGRVAVAGAVASKAGLLVSPDAPLHVSPGGEDYVGRGGLKLAAALDHFALSVTGSRCLDVGASTGGFTSCLLARGAAQVVAIDVGHSQLDKRLALDPRVVCYEGINARDILPGQFGEPFDMVVADLSFISLLLVLPALIPQLSAGGRLILLIKPQFEVGRERLGKKGIVKDPSLRQAAADRVCQSARDLGLSPLGLIECPIPGVGGNQEYLAGFAK